MHISKRLSNLTPLIEQNEISRLQAVIESTKTADDINSLIIHHCVSQADAARMCGISLNTFKDRVVEAKEQGVIDDVMFESNKYLYSLGHMHALMDWMGIPKWSDKNKGNIIINVVNQKGGTGKSTTVISLAAGIALRMNERRRVLIIDLDPQGTLQQVTAPRLRDSDASSELVLSAVDIMLGSEEKDSDYAQLIANGYTHQEILEYSILKTHIPNLDVLPSFPTDERFSQAAWMEYAKTGELMHVKRLKSKIIEPLSNHYDLILIDTGPHVNPLSWSALEACNALLVPVCPRKLDWVSTGQFLSNLPEQMSYLPSKGDNVKFFKAITVNYDEEQGRDIEMLHQIKTVLGRDVLNATIKRSSAFEAASRNYRTVFDLRKKDNLCPDRQLDKAISSLNDAIRELLLTLEDVDFSEEN
ncbi:ParA family protein [Rheinheimera sp. UJ51]|uniref:ParA family protein n=1 Tax=Rheinheimera sp. UJ51 TaxID=2892446 RepID=UPI001E41C8B8|nr:ParA family protein [Rheinheimera sp. UJ51]MCC5453135.1 ParA family protein [Rheinheimera sp. UJ51]